MLLPIVVNRRLEGSEPSVLMIVRLYLIGGTQPRGLWQTCSAVYSAKSLVFLESSISTRPAGLVIRPVGKAWT